MKDQNKKNKDGEFNICQRLKKVGREGKKLRMKNI